MDLPQEWKETSHDQSRGDSKKKKKEKRPKVCKKKKEKLRHDRKVCTNTFILWVLQ